MLSNHSAALLHDVADSKYLANDPEAETKKINECKTILAENGMDSPRIERVFEIIEGISFSKHGTTQAQSSMSLEMQVVQDSDRLDAIGAIGIARTFTYGGSRGRVDSCRPVSSHICRHSMIPLLLHSVRRTDPR